MVLPGLAKSTPAALPSRLVDVAHSAHVRSAMDFRTMSTARRVRLKSRNHEEQLFPVPCGMMHKINRGSVSDVVSNWPFKCSAVPAADCCSDALPQ